MKYEYKHEHEITYSEVDKNVKLGLLNSVLFAQDMMTKYFRTIGSDNYTTKRILSFLSLKVVSNSTLASLVCAV